jgi:hypothetical protein
MALEYSNNNMLIRVQLMSVKPIGKSIYQPNGISTVLVERGVG